MDINKWKSVAIDVDTYAIVKAMGKQGFRPWCYDRQIG